MVSGTLKWVKDHADSICDSFDLEAYILYFDKISEKGKFQSFMDAKIAKNIVGAFNMHENHLKVKQKYFHQFD